MARLRFFGPARQAAGTGTADAPGRTVAEVVEWAKERYGPGLAVLLPTCALWLNGEQASLSQKVGDVDEVAILPPVAGG